MSRSRVTRHGPLARAIHWIAAASVLGLLGTAFLPILGFKFPWVAPHWILGLILTGALLVHIVSALFRRNLRSMGLGGRDLTRVSAALRPGRSMPPPGKYTLAQKLMHHGVATAGLVVIATGLLMMARIDTPFWRRNPYLLEAEVWGAVYVLHGFAALAFVSLVILHIYFSLRPEKGFYLRSMLLGWMTTEEHSANHDAALWPPDGRAKKGSGPDG
jgi:cytochrome b subunit of formate dehydrogenase